MITIHRSFSFIFCGALAVLAGCADEANEAQVDDGDVCLVEDENGAIVETACDDLGEPSLETQDFVPGGCSDPNQECNRIGKK